MTVKKGNVGKLKKDGDFVPPDGGWGWLIVVAAGFSNLFALPVIQQFGLLFRDKLFNLGFTSSQITTIINVNSAFTSCVGLANGPVFKTFSYRQVSLTGATVIIVALLMATFSNNFATYLISFAIYGAGFGISSSANALALNTYWKTRRRLATSLSWTTTGLGPILWPYIITLLFWVYGETGTVLVLTGLSLHTVACALLLQPVEWHSKNVKKDDVENLHKDDNKAVERKEEILKDNNSQNELSNKKKLKNFSVFSSQYLYNEDDPVNPGYEIIEGIPMMVKGNDGYFSQSRQSKSKLSSRDGSALQSRLGSKKPSMTNFLENRSKKSSTLYLNESKKNSSANLGAIAQERPERDTYKPKRKKSITLETHIPESEIEDCPTLKAPQDLKDEEKAVVDQIDPEKAKDIASRAEKHLVASKSSKSIKLDFQYGEKYNKDDHSNTSKRQTDENYDKKYLKDNHSTQSHKTKTRRKSNNFNYESEVLKLASLKLEQYLKDREYEEKDEKLKLLLNSSLYDEAVDKKNEGKVNGIAHPNDEHNHEEEEENLTLCQKIALFFDLDLLKDFTFINLVLGITLANFNEINFSILTPFILGDYGITKPQVAVFMSLLAGVDLSVRFCIPFVAGKIGWDNESFFLFGVMTMAMGRVVLSFNQNYNIVLLVAVMIGFGKGLRTVFMALVLPTYVPLHKLPGATGIQLLTAGIVFTFLGPVVGYVKDSTSIPVTLHCLNIFTWLTAISWGLEKYIRSRRQKIMKPEEIQ